MGTVSENGPEKHICLGILAHVDAGKTTLSEELLYLCGKIRKKGRVDHGDTFLDTFQMEKDRGITIFSKQAVFRRGGMEVTLLDTPGHADFSADMERTLQVLDYAVLVISGADGVQGHTLTLWKLLERYGIPVFIFVNKMDQEGTDRGALLEELKKRLSGNCVDFSQETEGDSFLENLAVCEESLLEEYLETGTVKDEAVSHQIARRQIFPCYFGSALKSFGVEELLEGLERFSVCPVYPEEFGAKVYKISRDEQGKRLTHMKITGGSLKVKSVLTYAGLGEAWQEKADQLRIYSGARYETVPEVTAGCVCAVAGLTKTFPGQGLGVEPESGIPVLEPVLNYQILLPPDCEVHQMLRSLKELEEEEPQLHIVWNERLQEVHAQLMGEVQIEILKRMIWDRFHTAVDFGQGSIVYKETILEPVEGVGHFEPLRHYAEVHLLLEPGDPGSGLQFFTACSEDVLDRNWQRLILTHLEEREHVGVLTGSPITDMQITLLTGRAHLKHTEGGDFRQATYRAVRQGLKKARSILLEPYYEFRLEIPAENVGRAIADIQKLQGEFRPVETEGENAVLTGTAPVSGMRDYQKEVAAYTHGRGRMFCTLSGYAPCRNQAEVVKAIGYDSERDLENPTGSVFCAHGAGFVVPWDQVEEYMHLQGWELSGDKEGFRYDEAELDFEEPEEEPETWHAPGKGKKFSSSGSYEADRELQEIFERTFGPVKKDRSAFEKRTVTAPSASVSRPAPKKKTGEEYLLVDGYNIIFAWEELKALAEIDINAAKDRLIDILANYQGYKKCTLILVFDAYKVQGHREEVTVYHNIYVVYTKEAETADQYIEKTVHRIGKNHQVTVATSDRLEQIIIMGQGASRISASGLKEEVELSVREMRQEWGQHRRSSRSYLFDHVSGEVADYLESLRLGGSEE